MKIGMVVNTLHNMSLEEIAQWASSVGLENFELPAGPGSRLCDPDRILAGNAGEVRSAVDQAGIQISAINYATNHLDPNPEKRDANNAYMRKVIEAAAQLEVPNVMCFVGGDLGKGFMENMGLFEDHFLPLLAHAKDNGVKLCIENCPAGGWNIANNPAVLRELFVAADDLAGSMALEFDPSHAVWLQLDYSKFAEEFAPRTCLMHAKDTIVDNTTLSENGIMGVVKSWWSYKIPGRGVINWPELLQVMHDGGFDGPIHIEHEDSEYSGSEEKQKQGLLIGLEILRGAIADLT
ncbi:MAG TPA: sugar phosphate isomerase/epimerase [Candidatus Lokiarchaeia archaeon]|nr:sugar phosphate isomerase/epimerase [Candidatus Lokiarchaeia archaeon]